MIPASPITGNFYYVCVLTTGSSWTLASGEKPTDCKGSYLQKHLDGTKVATYALAYNGQVVKTQTLTGRCLLAVAGVVGMVMYPPSGISAWAYSSTINGLGMLASVAL